MSDVADAAELSVGLNDSTLGGGTVFNLGKALVMIVDDDTFSLRLIAQTLFGFGVKSRHQFGSADEAIEALKVYPIDLLIVDCDMPGKDGYDLVTWLRRSRLENAWVPVIMVSGHTRESRVTKARDCGAHFIVARPLSPLVLLERILWVARDPRPMLQAGDYAGPDRRFKDAGPPKATGERRQDAIRAAMAADMQRQTDSASEGAVGEASS